MFRFVASVVLDSMNARRILREICSNDDDCGCPSLYLFCVALCTEHKRWKPSSPIFPVHLRQKLHQRQVFTLGKINNK